MMNRKEFRVWASRVEELTPFQVEQLIMRLRHLKKIGGDSTVQVTTTPETVDWLYTGIVSALRSKGLVSTAAEYKLQQSKGYKAYSKISKQMRTDLENILGRSGRSYARQTLSVLAGEALYNWCERKRIFLTASNVLGQSAFIREAIEDQFPGYISSNLIQFVIGENNDGPVTSGTSNGRYKRFPVRS